jgi:hypothetical protein
MGLDDMLKQQIRDRAPELKQKLVNEFDEPTQKDMDETATIRTSSSIAFSRKPASLASRSSSAFRR